MNQLTGHEFGPAGMATSTNEASTFLFYQHITAVTVRGNGVQVYSADGDEPVIISCADQSSANSLYGEVIGNVSRWYGRAKVEVGGEPLSAVGCHDGNLKGVDRAHG